MNLRHLIPACLLFGLLCIGAGAPAQDSTGQSAVARRIGAIKSISGSSLTLGSDSGPDIAVTVQPNARLLRIAPGAKDLKDATPVQLADLQVGDTVRVRGYASQDAKSINALEVILITRSAVDAVRDQIRQDWQKRGIAGLVDSVDPGTGTVTISIPSLGAKRTIAVHTSKSTAIRRYAPDSTHAEDAKPSTLQDIQGGDQLRARGNRSTEGNEFAAEEIFVGNFPQFAGTVKSVDPSAGTISLQDLATKKTLQVKVTPDSKLHKIPAEAAQHFAAMLKRSMPPGTPGAAPNAVAGSSGAASGNGAPQPGVASAAAEPGGDKSGGGMGGRMRSGGAPDFQQIVNRLPASTLADLQLQKGDAIVVLATAGTSSVAGTVITLLSGVEPILQAAPNGSQAMMLAPWTLGSAPGGDAGIQ